MNRPLRILALTLCTALCLTFPVCAQSTVSYEGNAKRFVFSVGSSQAPEDLFGGFKQILPGDTLIDEIEIRAKPRRNHRVNLYLRADGVESESQPGFLEKLRLRVEQSSGQTVFDGTLDKTSGSIYLGSFLEGDTETLSMTLYAPLDLPNQYQNAVSSLRWTFLAEEISLPKSPDGPKTGDAMPVYLNLFLLSGICLVYITGRELRRNPVRRRRS